jgi:predicted nucleic acid-binding protein
MTTPDALLDTSVLVRAVIEAMPSHREARGYLDDAVGKQRTVAITTHALAEFFSTVTALPTRPQHTPQDAKALTRRISDVLQIVDLTAADYQDAIDRMVEQDLSSGAIYDGLHLVAAERIGANELVTFNGRDFRRMPPQTPTELVVLPS